MGLTIHYRFYAPKADGATAKELVRQLWRAAAMAGFREIGQIRHLVGNQCDPDVLDRDEAKDQTLQWLLIQAAGSVRYKPRHSGRTQKTCYADVIPLEVIAFHTLPGAGCEPANFGLCRYPPAVQVQDGRQKRSLPTRLGTGWHWHSFCKTQYASNPRSGGVENFLRCHLGIVKVLDAAKALGILREVLDEGNYWQDRDVQSLARQVGQWNQMVAAAMEALGNQARQIGGTLSAPICQYPDFPHLAAKGKASGHAASAKPAASP